MLTTKIKTGISVRSTAFSQGGQIPKKYSCEGENINPPLDVSGFPRETRSLALILEDPDAVKGIFYHWVMWNIPPKEFISENSIPGITGSNSAGEEAYLGPCPPSGSHRYYFRVFALDTLLDLPAGSDKKALEEAMQGHQLSTGEIMAHYRKGS
jgi:Raf kinase inhibitor-like YbhB/YbcL family protein